MVGFYNSKYPSRVQNLRSESDAVIVYGTQLWTVYLCYWLGSFRMKSLLRNMKTVGWIGWIFLAPLGDLEKKMTSLKL